MLGADVNPGVGANWLVLAHASSHGSRPDMDDERGDEPHDSRTYVVMVWREHYRDRYILGLHHTRRTATEALSRFLVKYPAGAGTIDPYFVA